MTLLTTCLLLLPLAQEVAVPAAPPAAALDCVSATDLRADVAFLSDDALRGRATPSPELAVVALYLCARLQRLGLEPGARGSWFHEYALVRRCLDEELSGAELSVGERRLPLRFARDYYYDHSSAFADSDRAGPVVSIGTGEREELTAAALEGSWALLADEGAPSRRLRRRLREAGALGLLVTPGPGYRGAPYSERFAARTLEARRPSVSLAAPAAAPEPLAFPVVHLARAAVAPLLGPEGELPPAGTRHEVAFSERRVFPATELQGRNVCAWLPGADPELAREVLVLSAHYDHLGVRGRDVYNGADDNASGTACLLAVAEALTRAPALDRSLLLLWVSGEERGLWGSRAWARNPVLPDGCRVVANLNLDMEGRGEPELLLLTPSREHASHHPWAGSVYGLAPLEGFSRLTGADRYWSSSDQASFHRELGVPVLYLSASYDHEDYHRPTDTADKLDYDKLRRIARLVVRLVEATRGLDFEAATAR